jgi:hypothetical protein
VGGYQWAFSASSPYIAADQTYGINLTIIPNTTDGSFRIQANNGAQSYLAVNGEVTNGSWQRAFFGTQTYLNTNSLYISKFFTD